MKRSPELLKALGPGLIMAGAAVGVSHLVQSTRAGAEYGLLLLGLVIAACIMKYPFLEFGPRYAAATGESLITGYRRLGRWALAVFTAITLSTAFIILAGVTVVTAGLAGFVLGINASAPALSAGVLAGCGLVLAVGRYRGLDLAMKLIMLVLAISTLAALALAIGYPGFGSLPDLGPGPGVLWTGAGIAFVLALLGWMPIPLDVAAWHSLWSQERARQTGHRPSVRDAVTDFRIGYIGATVLAAAFLALGALLMYGRGEGFPDQAVDFSARLVDLYAATLGEWSRPLIALAALTTMFSTTLAVLDAYPRAIRALAAEAMPRHIHGREPWLYLISMALLAFGALGMVHLLGARFTVLVDFATTLSFLSAPVIGWMSLKVITGAHMPLEAQPGPGLRGLAWAGLVFLTAFCLTWIGWRLAG